MQWECDIDANTIRMFDNPLTRAYTAATSLRSYLELPEEVPVYPLVVFKSPCRFETLDTNTYKGIVIKDSHIVTVMKGIIAGSKSVLADDKFNEVIVKLLPLVIRGNLLH